MKYGITLPDRGPLARPEELSAMAGKAEELGYDNILVSEHIVIPRRIASAYPYNESGEFPGGPSGESMEQLTLLSYLAGCTSKIRLAPSVMVVPYRSPLLAAKVLATLDVLSQGRLVVSIGVGWMREEFEALGLPPFEERGAVTDEYLRAFKELWTNDNPSFQGKYVSFDNISFLPKPVQKPYPPIWVGGESRPALRRAAELADGWYPLASNSTYPMSTLQQLADGIKRLASYARRFGRDPGEIEVIYGARPFELKKNGVSPESGRLPFVGTVDQVASDIRRYEEIGVGSLIFDFASDSDQVEPGLHRMEEFATQVWPKV
jgi:probable F420-dependent oxidoreductase